MSVAGARTPLLDKNNNTTKEGKRTIDTTVGYVMTTTIMEVHAHAQQGDESRVFRPDFVIGLSIMCFFLQKPPAADDSQGQQTVLTTC